MLLNPYYVGYVRYMGVLYPGSHPPLVSHQTWDQVQQIMATRTQAHEKERVHHHHLKGSLFCGHCKTRMIVSNAKSRSGKIYPYFVCSGRHEKRNDCMMKAVLIESVEEKVERRYQTIQLDPKVGRVLHSALSHDLAVYQREAGAEHDRLKKRQRSADRSSAENSSKPTTRARCLSTCSRANRTGSQASSTRSTRASRQPTTTTALSRSISKPQSPSPTIATPATARQPQPSNGDSTKPSSHGSTSNEDANITSELAEPFNTLLSPNVKARTQAAIHLGEVTLSQEQPSELNWQLWEASLTNNTPRNESSRVLVKPGLPEPWV